MEGNTANRNNIDETGEHDAKWNKPETKEQTLHNSFYIRHIIVKLIESESRIVVARGQWEG